MTWIVAALMVPLTALCWRLRGHRLGDGVWASNFWNRALWASWAGLALAVATILSSRFEWWGLLALPGGFVAAIMGHRSYIAAGVPGRPAPIDGERHEAHALWALVVDWRRWPGATVDAVGLLWTGALRGLLIGAWYGPGVAGVMVVAGALAHLAGYWIGGRIEALPGAGWIERSEWLTGALLGLGFAVVAVTG